MKRNLLLIYIALLPVVTNAYDAEIDGIYYNFSGNEAIVTYQKNQPTYTSDYFGAVVIPKSIIYNGKTYSVTSIGDHAFQNCSSLTSINIGGDVKIIGDYAFKGCKNLTQIIYGSGGDAQGPNGDITDLVNGSFESWVSESEPTGWKSASTASNANVSQSTDARTGSYACRVMAPGIQNKRLATQEMTLAAGSYTFSYYAKSTTADVCQSRGGYVPINAGGSVGAYQYATYTDLNNISWTLVTYDFKLAAATKLCLIIMNPKNSQYSVSQDILIDDAQLTTNPANVKHLNSIDTCSFDGSSNLVSIGKYAFADCESLNNIIIPNSVTNIGEGSFNGCTSLTSITIPNSVTSIDTGTFYNCI